MLIYRDHLLDLNVSLAKVFDDQLKVSELRHYLLKRIRIFCNFYYVLVGVVTIANVFFVVIPLKAIYTMQKYSNIYPSHYPLSYEPGGTLFWCIFLLEAATCFYLCCGTLAIDNAYGLYVFQICGQLQILRLQFQSLKPGPDYRRKLKECVQKHQYLIHCRDNVQEIFGFLVMWLCVTGSLVLCALVFQASKVRSNSLPTDGWRLNYL